MPYSSRHVRASAGAYCTTVQASGVITIDGGITFTAANGDMLTITHQGTASIEGNIATALDDWQVAEGTGRFLGATGSGESIQITYIPTPAARRAAPLRSASPAPSPTTPRTAPTADRPTRWLIRAPTA